MSDIVPQGDVIVVEDYVDMQCMRHVHWMSNNPPAAKAASPQMAPDGRNLGGVGGEWMEEAGVWHLRWSGPFRGALEVRCEGWPRGRRLVVWSLAASGERLAISVRMGLYEAAMEFERLFGGRARFGFVRRMPKGAEHGMEVGDLMLLEAEWMLGRAVAVGGRAVGG